MSKEEFSGVERHRPQIDNQVSDGLNALTIFPPPPLSSDRSAGVRENRNYVNDARPANARLETAMAFLPDADSLLDGLKDRVPQNARINRPLSERVHQLINGEGDVISLGASSERPGVSFRNRERAQRELTELGLSALPQLLLVHGETNDLQVLRGSRSTIGDIVRNISDAQLLQLRDQEFRDRVITTSLGRQPSAEESVRLNTAFDLQITNALSSRLITPDWLRETQIFADYKQPARSLPTEETVRQFDRLATPEGRRQITDRITQLNAIFASDRLTNAERESITQQMRELNEVMSPVFVSDGRISARLAFAQLRNSVAPIEDQAIIHRNVLEAVRLSGDSFRGGVIKTILEMGLDQNAGFMQQLAGQVPAARIQQIRDGRQLMIRMQEKKTI